MLKWFPGLLILALIPIGFAVAYEYQPRGVSSPGIWLPVWFALVVTVLAHRLGSRAVQRTAFRAIGWLALIAGAVGYGHFLFGVAKFVGLTPSRGLWAASTLTLGYVIFGLVAGRASARVMVANTVGGVR